MGSHMGVVFRHLQLIGYLSVYDKFDFDHVKIDLFINNFNGVFASYADGEFTISDFKNYCDVKGCDVYAWVKTIPIAQKVRFADCKKMRDMPRAIKEIETAFIVYAMVADLVLGEIFNFDTGSILQFNEEVKNCVDSYVRKRPKSKECYLTDGMICGLFTDELDMQILKKLVRFDDMKR